MLSPHLKKAAGGGFLRPLFRFAAHLHRPGVAGAHPRAAPWSRAICNTLPAVALRLQSCCHSSINATQLMGVAPACIRRCMALFWLSGVMSPVTSDNINLYILARGGQRRQHHAAGGPQPADDDFLAAGLFDQVHHAPILPDVDGGAIVHLQVESVPASPAGIPARRSLALAEARMVGTLNTLAALAMPAALFTRLVWSIEKWSCQHVLQIDQQQQTVLGGQRLNITVWRLSAAGDCASAATGARRASRASRANRVFFIINSMIISRLNSLPIQGSG